MCGPPPGRSKSRSSTNRSSRHRCGPCSANGAPSRWWPRNSGGSQIIVGRAVITSRVVPPRPTKTARAHNQKTTELPHDNDRINRLPHGQGRGNVGAEQIAEAAAPITSAAPRHATVLAERSAQQQGCDQQRQSDNGATTTEIDRHQIAAAHDRECSVGCRSRSYAFRGSDVQSGGDTGCATERTPRWMVGIGLSFRWRQERTFPAPLATVSLAGDGGSQYEKRVHP